ncbi:hypothetical protein ES703_101705 [subsurface metagenome]
MAYHGGTQVIVPHQLDVVDAGARFLDLLKEITEAPGQLGEPLLQHCERWGLTQLPLSQQLRSRAPHRRGRHTAVAGYGGGTALNQQVQANGVVQHRPVGVAVDVHPSRGDT